jgi:hypothetical protein
MKVRICKSCGDITEIGEEVKRSSLNSEIAYIAEGFCMLCAGMDLIKALEEKDESEKI